MNSLVLAVLFSNLVWGLSPLMAKFGLESVSDVSFLLIRFGISTALFLPFILRSVRKFGQLPVVVLALGVATVTVHYYLQVVALRQVPVTWYVFFYSLCPVLNLLVVGAELNRKNLAVGALAILGTCLFVDFGTAPQITMFMLVVLILSVLSWVLFTWTVKKWQRVLSDAEVSGTTSALSFAIFACWGVGNTESLTSQWTWQTSLMTILLAILLPLAFMAYSYSLRKNPEVAVLGQYSEPVFGTIGAIFILGESLSLRQSIGMAFMGAALWFLLTKRSFAISHLAWIPKVGRAR